MKVKLEYIWLDGYKPEPNIRSKTKIWDFDPLTTPKYQPQRQMSVDGRLIPVPSELPNWSFDGSSTKQAEGGSSDCILKPVRVVKDPQRLDAYLVLCEVYNSEGKPHASNTRDKLINDEQYWFGFEQEYVLTKDGKPLGFPKEGYPAPQGEYYCGVGTGNATGRDIVEEHLQVCLEAGLNITGVNAEVMVGQWEYQIFGRGCMTASDDLWLSRYLLNRISERYDVKVELHPKPIKGDWNGSGMHCNFSSDLMRESGTQELMFAICDTLGAHHEEHMKVYGSNNEERLTGLHETQHISKFSYGISDRGASIRIPIHTVENNWKGYLEDRRPASNADPYTLTLKIFRAIEEAEKEFRTITV